MGGIYSRIATLDNKSGWRVKHLYNLSCGLAFLAASENLGEGFNPNSSEINIKTGSNFKGRHQYQCV